MQAFGFTKDLVVAGADGEIAHSELGWRGAVINVVSYTDGKDTLTRFQARPACISSSTNPMRITIAREPPVRRSFAR